MHDSEKDIKCGITRRSFLAKGSCGAMTIAPLVNTISQLKLIQSGAASTIGEKSVSSDYKALICLFLRGGCDMNNVLIPIGNHPQAPSYKEDRAVIEITEEAISTAETTLNFPTTTDQQLGLHPSLKNLSAMFNSGEASFITNVGTLAAPTTRDTYNSVVLPQQLFSHSNQQNEWMSSVADKPFTSGWGGRVADLLHDTMNPNSNISMMVTAAGNNDFMVTQSGSLPQYTVSSTGAISLGGFGTNYSGAFNSDGSFRTNANGQRLKAIEQIIGYSHENILESGYATIVKRARESESVISEAISSVTELGLNFQSTFNDFGIAFTDIGEELLAIANMIAGRERLGNNRQIFFVDQSGYDDHKNVLSGLSERLDTLDKAIAAFNKCMKDLAAADPNFKYEDFTVFEASDFNRTWTPNATDPNVAGTDHAWGTHSFIFGGAVDGGKVFGTGLPELSIGGADDVPSGSRGRWIPTTSVDQYSAVIAKWFGVGASEMETIFPNLYRFEDPFSSPDLNLNIFG